MLSDSGVILLAAGSGLRFGSNKLLVDFNGHPLCYYSMNVIKNTGLPAIVIYEDESVADIARSLGLNCLKASPDFKGQGVSISIGAKYFNLKRSVMIVVADQPFIKAQTLIDLNNRYKEIPTDKILTCHVSGRRCPPLIFGRNYFKDLKAISGDIGARDVLFRHPESIEIFELTDDTEAIDIDTKEQFTDLVNQMVFPDKRNN